MFRKVTKRLPDITEQNMHIWFGKIVPSETLFSKFFNILSEDEKQRIKKFKFDVNKNQFIWCRGLLRVLSGHYLDTPPESIHFKYGKHGKPYYDDITSLKFSVSHSGNYGVLGFTINSELGVDIERIKSNFDVLDIANNFFSTMEIENLKAIETSKHIEAFYRCWTRKEAFIKAKTEGLSFPLDSFSVSLDSDLSAELLETKWDIVEKEGWKLYSFKPTENYITAVCVNKRIKKIHYYDWNHFFNFTSRYIIMFSFIYST